MLQITIIQDAHLVIKAQHENEESNRYTTQIQHGRLPASLDKPDSSNIIHTTVTAPVQGPIRLPFVPDRCIPTSTVIRVIQMRTVKLRLVQTLVYLVVQMTKPRRRVRQYARVRVYKGIYQRAAERREDVCSAVS